MICNKTEFHLVPNQTGNGKYNPNLVCIKKIIGDPKLLSLINENKTEFYLVRNQTANGKYNPTLV